MDKEDQEKRDPPQDSRNSLQDDLPEELQKKGLHFIHINARSLIPKLSEIKLLLSKTKAAVLAISESWLDETVPDNEVRIDGYSILRRDRNRHGGGVMLLIKDGLAFNPRPDLHEHGLEAMWVELLLPKTKGILFCCCYRPPTDESFLAKFENMLSKVELGQEIYVLGDLNINFSQKQSTQCKKYINILNLFHCKQIITEPTRTTSNSNTILDHIVTNCVEKISNSGVFNNSFSDHIPIYCPRKIVKSE